MAVKAVALLSGGLDSTLAVKLMIEQGIEVFALNFTSAFCTCNAGGKAHGGCKSESKRVADEFGIPIKVMLKGFDYIEIVRNAKHGYGKGINPCIDCRIYMFNIAKEYMKEIGASFIITGEVLGQRPMSQRLDAFHLIEKESDLEGYILRPLCAQHLTPTIAEQTGLVDRERLLAVSGRSRKEQIGLAKELDINDYPCPSGGCLLTDKMFSKKVRDLLDHTKDVTKRDLNLLKSGRHFRYDGVKIIVGRDEAENAKLKSFAGSGDILVEPANFAGPVALITGDTGNGARTFAASLVVRYSSGKADGSAMLTVTLNGASEVLPAPEPASDERTDKARVC
jgi:tRNA U34 2-thiouridine synthase MnmA/TrmU